MSKLGFKGTLLASISLLVAISVGISNYLTVIEAQEVVEGNIYNATENRVNTESNMLENYLTAKGNAIEKLAADYQEYQYTDKHVERVRVSANAADVINIIVGFENGEAYASYDYPDWINHKAVLSRYDPRKRPWYIEAKNTPNQVIYTDVYPDASTNELMISVAKAFDNGVTIADITLEILTDIVEGIDIPGSASVVISQDTTILASSSKAVKNGEKLSDYASLSPLVKGTIGKESAIIDYKLNDIDKVAFTHRINIGNKHLYLITALDKNIVFADVNEIRHQAVIMTGIYVAICVLLSVLIINYLYRPILVLKTTMASLASGNGDLTQRLEVNSNDDLGQIADYVNRFITSLQEMMIKIENATIKLKDDVKELNEQTQDNTDMLEQHLVETEQIVTAIEEMSATADSVAQHAAETANSTEEATEMGTESKQVVSKAQTNVTSLMSEVDDTAELIQNMNNETQEISTILGVIGEIADQTNLLALNAAIEAARAGEQGRGFAVVADEVRALASRTQVSTGEIEKALESLVSGSSATSTSMDITRETCKETFETTEQVDNQIGNLTNHINKIRDLSIQIATAAEEQSSVTQEVSNNMTSINQIVNQLNDTGRKTASQTESIHEVNLHLNRIVEQFKLR